MASSCLTELRRCVREMGRGEAAAANFGEWLAAVRVEAGISQAGLARHYGCSPTFINNVEAGRKAVSYNVAVDLVASVEEIRSYLTRGREYRRR